MLFQNQYTILKKANDLSMETLNADNRATVKDICDRLRGMTWNQYEIERIRKDLIDISARCELEGRTLQEEIGGDPDVFLLELAPDLPRGTPLDDVCIWYPRFFLYMIALNVLGALMPNSQDLNLVRVLTAPFQLMLWLLVWAWFQRCALKIKIRYGLWPQVLCYVVMLGCFALSCFFLPAYGIQQFPATISCWGACAYQLLWAIGCQFWQNFHYNRCAARHPWQEAPHTT